MLGAASMAFFEIVSGVVNVEEIARGRSIRCLSRLRRVYGGQVWRKMKGTAVVRLTNGHLRRAEIHWHEAHGIGRKEYKI